MKIAIGQIECVAGEVAANIETIRRFSTQAKSKGAEWIVFPEMSDTGYDMAAIRKHASPWSRGAVPELQVIARELQIGIVCGLSEVQGNDTYNSQVAINAHGVIIGKYRKVHLFPLGPADEQKNFSPGIELLVLQLGDLRAGLSICYDLRFPELYRSLVLDHGAGVLIIAAAWPRARVEHLRALAIARAIENQSYVALANRVGADMNIKLAGHSMIIDPAGIVIAEGSSDASELIQAELSKTRVEEVRRKMPVFKSRRPEIYAASHP